MVKWPRYFEMLERTYRKEVEDVLFLYSGYAIHWRQCRQKHYGFVCGRHGFRAKAFATGAFVYVPTPLARRVYLDLRQSHQSVKQRNREVVSTREK